LNVKIDYILILILLREKVILIILNLFSNNLDALTFRKAPFYGIIFSTCDFDLFKHDFKFCDLVIINIRYC